MPWLLLAVSLELHTTMVIFCESLPYFAAFARFVSGVKTSFFSGQGQKEFVAKLYQNSPFSFRVVFGLRHQWINHQSPFRHTFTEKCSKTQKLSSHEAIQSRIPLTAWHNRGSFDRLKPPYSTDNLYSTSHLSYFAVTCKILTVTSVHQCFFFNKNSRTEDRPFLQTLNWSAWGGAEYHGDWPKMVAFVIFQWKDIPRFFCPLQS